MFELKTLGGYDLRRTESDTGILSVVAQPKRFGLLAYLALKNRGSPVSRDNLLGVFWPELPDTRARGALRKALHFLRRSLGPDLIQSRGENDLSVNLEQLKVDLMACEDALSQEQFAYAVQLYHGPLLDGLPTPGLPEFEDWLSEERRGLEDRLSKACLELSEQARTESDLDQAIIYAEQALKHRPLDEVALRTLIQTQSESGNRTVALTTAERFRTEVRTLLDTEVSTETSEVIENIRARPAAMDPGVSLPDAEAVEQQGRQAVPGTLPDPAEPRHRSNPNKSNENRRPPRWLSPMSALKITWAGIFLIAAFYLGKCVPSSPRPSGVAVYFTGFSSSIPPEGISVIRNVTGHELLIRLQEAGVSRVHDWTMYDGELRSFRNLFSVEPFNTTRFPESTFILTGSISRLSADSVQLSVLLLHANDFLLLWAEEVTVPLDDTFQAIADVTADLSQRIANAIAENTPDS